MASLDPRAIYTGLAVLLADLSGLALAGDKDGAFQFKPDDTFAEVRFSITGIVGVGTDENRRDYDPDAVIDGDTFEPDLDDPDARLGGVVESVHGNRRVTITVMVECHRQDRTASLYLERIRDKLALRSSRARLGDLGLALQRILASHDVSYDADHRPVSAYAFDVICNASSSVADAPITTIEQVDQTVTVT